MTRNSYGIALRSDASIWRFLEVARRGALLAGSPIHGERHWWETARVGTDLARTEAGADPFAVVLFALIHDCRRMNEHHDHGHGVRGANVLRKIFANTVLPVSVELAITASELHDTAHVERSDATVAVCLDADRLLLSRVGISPDPTMPSTVAARDHVAGTQRLMMPEPDEPLAWGQRHIIASRIQAGRPSSSDALDPRR